MPSPIGHALGGLAAGWLVQGPAGSRAAAARRWLAPAAFAGLAMAPDLDLLTDLHRGPTHSIGAAVLAGVAVWAILRLRRQPALRLALACGAAWGSHVLLDWLGSDSSPPIGLMALWPFSHGFYEAPLHVFLSTSRRFTQPEHFWIPNLLALARELVILAPLAAAVWYWRTGRRLTAPARSAGRSPAPVPPPARPPSA